MLIFFPEWHCLREGYFEKFCFTEGTKIYSTECAAYSFVLIYICINLSYCIENINGVIDFYTWDSYDSGNLAVMCRFIVLCKLMTPQMVIEPSFETWFLADSLLEICNANMIWLDHMLQWCCRKGTSPL